MTLATRRTLPLLLVLPTLCASIAACSDRSAAPPGGDPLAAAWAAYGEDVAAARARLDGSDFAEDPTLRAEAHRHLSGLIALHHRMALHYGDSAFPILHRSVAVGNKWGFSNPDNLYLSATVEGDAIYRVSGRLGTPNQTTIGSYSGNDQDARAGERIRGEALELEPDGTFELIIGGDERPGNWLPLVPDATSISIYQIFADWDRQQKGQLRVERVGREGEAPAPLEIDLVAARIRRTGAEILDSVETWVGLGETLAWIPENTFAPPREIQVASLGAWFVAGHYAVEQGQHLLIEMPAPKTARYWGFTTYNPWGETLDYANRQTSLNFVQTDVGEDGMIRLVLSTDDPGVANWIDLAGHAEGFVAWRVTDPSEPERPTTRFVSDAEIEALVQEGALAAISHDERRAVIARRQAHVARRYAE